MNKAPLQHAIRQAVDELLMCVTYHQLIYRPGQTLSYFTGFPRCATISSHMNRSRSTPLPRAAPVVLAIFSFFNTVPSNIGMLPAILNSIIHLVQ